ncbi:MAG: CHRD domain-containing protein, partial [Pseudomonadota bacterium]
MTRYIKSLVVSILLVGLIGPLQAADEFAFEDDGTPILRLESVDINLGDDVEERTDLEFELLPPGSSVADSDIAFKLRESSIRDERIIHTRTILSAGSQVPPIQSGGAGVANISVNLNTGEVKGVIEMDNMMGVVAAHAHRGTPGGNGPVVFDLAGPRGNFLDDKFLLVPEGTTHQVNDRATISTPTHTQTDTHTDRHTD